MTDIVASIIIALAALGVGALLGWGVIWPDIRDHGWRNDR